MAKIVTGSILLCFIIAGCHQQNEEVTLEQWDVYELVLDGPSDRNPFLEVQLLEMGIEADVILFHPYDIWGYFEMGDEMNDRYVRYLIARLSV